jgi:thiol-disulfide isomerase/thioredoxin
MTETEKQTPSKPRLSPGLLVLLVFPLLGLVIGGAMILSEGGIPGLVSVPTSIPPTPAPVALPTSPPPVVQLNGEPAPDFELTAMDQTRVKLSDFRGRVVFLNFWATWCGPCEREMPAFQAFMEDQPEDGPIVVGVNLGETYDAVKPYLDERGIHSFPILLDVRYIAGNLYGIGPIPVTYVIDEEGMIRYSKFGEITTEDMQEYLAALAESRG